MIEDAEIADDKEDFDRAKHEVEIFDEVFHKVGEAFINGNFFDLEDDVLANALIITMTESKKMPECLVVLKNTDNDKYLERVFDKKAIET